MPASISSSLFGGSLIARRVSSKSGWGALVALASSLACLVAWRISRCFAVPKQEGDNLKVVSRCLADLKQDLASEARSWGGDTETSQRTLNAALNLVFEAKSSCCLIVAPSSNLQRLKQYTRHSDGGFFTRKFHDKRISHEDFQRTFSDFTDLSISDAWPEDYPDVDARNQPKDGAVLFSSAGLLEEGAVEFVDLPKARFLWPEYGSRHAAALQAASLLEQVVVFVKSHDGLFHILLGRPESMVDARHEVPAIAVVTNMGGNHICGFVCEDRSKLLIELREVIASVSGFPIEQVAVMRGVEVLIDMESLVLEEATIDKPVGLTLIRSIVVKQESEPDTKGDGENKSEDQSALQHDEFDPAEGVVSCRRHGTENPREDCPACRKWVNGMDVFADQAKLGGFGGTLC